MESMLRSGHPDVEGLCLALVDWSWELRLLWESQGLATVAPRLAHVGSSRADRERRPRPPSRVPRGADYRDQK
jgi:hypothetical protein